jgi:hypothetical protein
MSQPTLQKGWRRATIEEVVRFDTDSLIPEPVASYTDVGLEHIESETGKLIGEQKIAGTSIRGQKFRFTNEHALYGKLRPYLNKVALPDFNGICSTDIMPLQPKHNVVRQYLAYWLRSRGFLDYARTHATGTKIPRLGPSQLSKAAIPLPPLPVQERIVEILQKAYSIRHKRHEALDLADLILSSAFIEMFGNPKGNPKHFEVVPLGDLSNIRSGVTKGWRLRGKETLVLLDFVRERQRSRPSEPVLIISLMKYVFLLPKEGTTGQTLYHFVPYKYGPFAKELYQDLEALAADGCVAVTETDEERTKIALVREKEATVQKAIAELSEDLRAAVLGVLNQDGDLSYNQLLATVYENFQPMPGRAASGADDLPERIDLDSLALSASLVS